MAEQQLTEAAVELRGGQINNNMITSRDGQPLVFAHNQEGGAFVLFLRALPDFPYHFHKLSKMGLLSLLSLEN